MMNNYRFTDKVAIVTGGARGLGKATALLLAQQGAAVVICDVRRELADNAVDEIIDKGGRALSYAADISNANDVEDLVASTVDYFGTVDILVNNAGIMRTTSPAESIPAEEWSGMFDVNVTGVFQCMKAVLPIFKERRSGKIVNVSSSAGRSMSTFNGAHYTACKAAVLGLTRHIANEAAPYNVNVNAVAPGSFATEGGLELVAGAPPEALEAEAKKIPMRRFGKPEDHANLVAFLCSEESSYITGATVDINGGDLMM
ncbi:SDR family oxidoreductase [Pseudomaricurvus alkylphenolicus]|uniref:SDR family NAD(P)-dependent oxidoreductase n=1 Tax=Pseudomaricurvus alkylphenolicus TaxID=1306991 RepID=UPI00142497FE|nr:SDR family NAD(P)-dependent oxidoreductase [Pseudomaricurvus alkylphenolicus]NIB38476.1 SDR family oxidoreductase [Pseudomaricurvus alkylphenolicus]